MTIQAMRAFLNRHTASVTGLAALGAALDAKTSGASLPGTLAERVEALLAAMGASDVLTDLGDDEARAALAEIRSALALESKLLYARTRATSWSYSDPDVLQGVGDMSAGFIQPLA